MNDSTTRPSRWRVISQVGPGIAIAATGVGAADLVASTVAGARFGTTLAWAILVGALLKFALNEGVARWHVSTGTSVLQGWARYLGKPALAIFVLYLSVWSLVVCGGLIVGSGLAAHSVFPGISRQLWGVLQALVALAMVWWGSYERFEQWMKVIIGVMFVAIVGSAVVTGFTVTTPLQLPSMPEGSLPMTLGLAGGVGGSVTMMVYGYWIKERNWDSAASLPMVRIDLSIAYGVTGLLALGAMLLASQTLMPQGIAVEGQQGLIQMALMLKTHLGSVGQWVFLIGFWGAAFSSLLGVLQGIPYLFADIVHSWTEETTTFDYSDAENTVAYKICLVYLVLPSMAFVFYDRPIWLMVIYAAVSSFFLPVLATALLVMNNRWVEPAHRNGWKSNATLAMALGLFVYLAIDAFIG